MFTLDRSFLIETNAMYSRSSIVPHPSPSRYEPPLQYPLQSLSLDSATSTFGLGNLHALSAVVAWMCPLALQLFNTSAYMEWVVPSNVTVGKAVIDLVTTAIRNELKVTHFIPVFSKVFSLRF